MAEEGTGFSLDHNSNKVTLCGKLIFMAENFILLLVLLGVKRSFIVIRESCEV